MSRRNKAKTRLQQLREQIVKMGGEDVATRFETLQLHAGESFRVVGNAKGPFTAIYCATG